MSRQLSGWEMAVGGYKFFRYLAMGGLFNINLEVTKRCNARCDFCDYWQEKAARELADYVPVLKRLKPLSVGLTGGEPLLRKDLVQVIAGLRRNFGFLFISLITNGALLTRERGLELWRAGLDELSISLDYFDERHDQGRKIPGLVEHILEVVPQLTAAGVNLCFNVVIKRGNYLELPAMVERAAAMGVKISLSTYNCWRVNNDDYMVEREELTRLRGVLEELKQLKQRLGNITTSTYYLDRVAEFFEKRGISGCTAGVNWVQVTPDGMFKCCSDHPVAGHYTEWHEGFFEKTDCDRCWYSCRGAAQEPWTMARFREMTRDALDW